MKKLIIPFLLVMAIAFQACEESQSPIYDGSQTLASFANASAQLGVPALEASGTVSIPINVSSLSNSERKITISVDESSTALPSIYSFNTEVVVPANSHFASLEVTGYQNGLSEVGDNLVLNIEGIDGGVGSPESFTLLILKTCPYDISNFYGTYSSMQVYNGTSADLAAGSTVTATAGPEPNLILLTDLYAVGRQAMIELDYSDPDNPTIIHRSFEFNAIYQGGTSVGDLFTTETYATGGPNTFNTCTSGISLNYLRTNGVGYYNWPYIVQLTKL